MAIARTIVAVWVAVSVALLPIAGGMAAVASAPTATAKATVVSMPECCDHDDGMAMDHTSMNDMGNECQANAGCAAKCFSLYTVTFWGPFLHPPVASAEALPLTGHLRSQTSTPPFRPPRV